MIILEFTEEELDLIFDYVQDNSGTFPSSNMKPYLTQNNLWAVYNSVIEKLNDARHKEHPFRGLDQRVFALPRPWYMSDPWISGLLWGMALLAGFKLADLLALLWRWWVR